AGSHVLKQGKGFVLHRGVPDVRAAVVKHILEIGAHAGNGAAALGIRDAGFQRDLLEFLASQIVEQEVGAVVVGNENIHEPIAIVVGNRHTHTLAEEFGDARFHGDVSKSPVAVVAVQRVGQVRVVVGMAIGAQVWIRAAVGVLVHIPLAVVGDKQVQEAIVVVVHPRRRYGPHLFAIEHATAHTRLVRNVGEYSVAIVVEELILPRVNHIDIWPAIVVVVTDGHAHAVAC